MKFCKDCKHCSPTLNVGLWYSRASYEYAKCTRKDKIETNPVTGKKGIKSVGYYCSTERADLIGVDICGIEAKFWEAK